jgi:hypothetical protein
MYGRIEKLLKWMKERISLRTDGQKTGSMSKWVF